MDSSRYVSYVVIQAVIEAVIEAIEMMERARRNPRARWPGPE
jgi:hypothetical protein